jgi:hypothetical protein
MSLPRACRDAWQLLADGEGKPPASAGLSRWTWLALMLLGLGWGVAAVGLWHAAFELFGKPAGLYLLMGVTVAAGMLLGPYRRSAGALARLLGGPDPAVAASAITAVLVAALAVAGPDWHRQEVALPDWLAWIRPGSKIDRVLLLMPLWGHWAMLILPQFLRPDPVREPVPAGLARQCGPVLAAGLMGLLLALSIASFAYLPWVQLSISGAAILAAIFGGLLLARRRGTLDRDVLLACNLLTQMVLLLAFLANRSIRFAW